MLKRLLIVLSITAGIVIVPYFIGVNIDVFNYGERVSNISIDWSEGLVGIGILLFSLLICFGLYSIGCLIYDYIIGKK